jgi:hypothetical protein
MGTKSKRRSEPDVFLARPRQRRALGRLVSGRTIGFGLPGFRKDGTDSPRGIARIPERDGEERMSVGHAERRDGKPGYRTQRQHLYPRLPRDEKYGSSTNTLAGFRIETPNRTRDFSRDHSLVRQ